MALDFMPLDRELLTPNGDESESEESRLLKLIESPEGDNLEFKQTAWYCIQQKKSMKYIEQKIVDSIAAFLNTEGSNLIIGVKDSPREFTD